MTDISILKMVLTTMDVCYNLIASLRYPKRIFSQIEPIMPYGTNNLVIILGIETLNDCKHFPPSVPHDIPHVHIVLETRDRNKKKKQHYSTLNHNKQMCITIYLNENQFILCWRYATVTKEPFKLFISRCH